MSSLLLVWNILRNFPCQLRGIVHVPPLVQEMGFVDSFVASTRERYPTALSNYILMMLLRILPRTGAVQVLLYIPYCIEFYVMCMEFFTLTFEG
jgi:hypothetical protein